MKDGHLYRHESNGTGGCTVKVYTCQRCTRCGYLANAKYQNTVTYAVCPHKQNIIYQRLCFNKEFEAEALFCIVNVEDKCEKIIVIIINKKAILQEVGLFKKL